MRRGEVELSSQDESLEALNSEISSHESAELAVLYLFKKYDFKIEDLRRLLLVEDLDVIANQYGDPIDHNSVEARSRCLAPLFNRTVALFKLTIRNIPESTIPGRTTTKGRVVYHFVVFGGLSLVVIEVKYQLGRGEERTDAIAQVVAECDACDYSNDPATPIHGILCDGRNFDFFKFDASTSPPTFSRGIYNNLGGLSLAEFQNVTDLDYMRSLRPVCEVLFYFLLLTYGAGIRAYRQRSTSEGIRANHSQQSMPGWAGAEAERFADLALSHATNAAVMAGTQDPAADDETEDALKCLKQSLETVPASYKKNRNLFPSWDDQLAFC